MSKELPSIHFILPGGAVKGAFQAGFIYKLISDYSDKFTIYQVDCTSVGALNGLTLISPYENKEYIKNIWYSVSNIFDLFGNIVNNSFLQKIIALYNSIENKALLNSYPLKKKINDYLDQTDINNIQFEKFNCTVINLNSGKTEYINGNDVNIRKFILASASPWILTPPIKINEYEYSDGALLDLYPLKYLSKSKATYKIIIGYNKQQFNINGDTGNNMYTCINRIIDIAIYNRIIEQQEFILDIENDIIIIENTYKNCDNFNFNKNNIKELFELGEKNADDFARKYLN